MPRRRLRDGPAVNNLVLLAAVILLLPYLVNAQQQPRQAVRQRHESPHEGLDREVSSSTIDPSKTPLRLETQFPNDRRKKTINNNLKKKDVSALETLAPANLKDLAVAAPAVRDGTYDSTVLSSPHIARDLADWEVEDFVLLATVDGKLHARDRKTGQERWQISAEPMVSTSYNRSSFDERQEHDPNSIDDYLWIVEPSKEGNLYLYKPGGPSPGLVDTGLTMKRLVDGSPHADQSSSIVYVGQKTSTMVSIDAYTGKVVSYFGMESTLTPGAPSCRVSRNSDSCQSKTIALGQTVYTVSAYAGSRHIATIKYSEWSPNTFDKDLVQQYRSTFDKKYIHTSHDGGMLGLDYDEKEIDGEPGRVFQYKLSSPVAAVFDLARLGGPEQEAEALIVLPQPVLPEPLVPETDSQQAERAQAIFLNHTEGGSWYALSGKSYPLSTSIQEAECRQPGWLQHRPQWDILNNIQLSKDLVGLHSIANFPGYNDYTQQRRAIGAPEPVSTMEQSVSSDVVVDREMTFPRTLSIGQDLLQPTWTPVQIIQVMVLLVMGVAASRWKEIGNRLAQFVGGKKTFAVSTIEKEEAEPVVFKEDVSKLPDIPENDVVNIPANDGTVEEIVEKETLVESIEATKIDVLVTSADNEFPSPTSADAADEKPPPSPEKEKPKKAHRGRRGGVKHKKGPRAQSKDTSEDGRPVPAAPTVDDAVRVAQNMGPQKTEIEPDIRTMPSNPAEVSGPIIRIGALVVNTDKLIGTGSNGTMVFEGNFDGRDVAVKRMLVQFYDIASQETKLLRESDDHENVIRYFAQQQAAGFLYIALELCPASLADVIGKPQDFRSLAQAGEKDLPNVLLQITKGVSHLHKLRIVHRDLKPQNILVALDKDGKPRLLVSDFGLCKKLEGEQSSFRATTAHAAGTSGWRAPELLLDDDAKDGNNHQTMADASTEGNSGAVVQGAGSMPARRATRAIDIFSLGLVFFYVLTKGSHPYDCNGTRYMREINIRKGEYSLEQLDVLGDYAYEAKDLISSMLAAEPKQRPTAKDVMAHPFFWPPKRRLEFLANVSDHFEKEKRDPPTAALQELERYAPSICGSDFLKPLGKDFVDSLGKQRKYTGTRLLDLLRALRNKKNHYEDMSDALKKHVGPLPDGYLNFWTRRFPSLLIICWNVIYEIQWDDTDRFREYYEPYGVGRG